MAYQTNRPNSNNTLTSPGRILYTKLQTRTFKILHQRLTSLYSDILPNAKLLISLVMGLSIPSNRYVSLSKFYQLLNLYPMNDDSSRIPATNPMNGKTYDVAGQFEILTDYYEDPARYLEGINDVLEEIPEFFTTVPEIQHHTLLKMHHFIVQLKHAVVSVKPID